MCASVIQTCRYLRPGDPKNNCTAQLNIVTCYLWQVKDILSHVQLERLSVFQDSPVGVQPCHPLLEQCGEAREGSRHCGLYQLPVVSRQEGVNRCSTVHPAPAGGHHVFRYFRNPHCALCGGVANLSSLSCLASLPSLLSPPCLFLVPPSLSLTLDFSGQGAVGHRWGSIVSSYQVVVSSVHC